jgi:hypothetical protein
VVGHVVERDAQALLSEQVSSGTQDPLAVALGVLAEGAVGGVDTGHTQKD